VTKATGELARLRDGYSELEREGEKEAGEDTPMSRKIRLLENRLDKVCVSCE
jgi:hypothetical protein